MTDKFWKCDKCDHIQLIHLSMTVLQCPKCGALYRKIATIWGLHVCHTISIQLHIDDDYDKVEMLKGVIAIATSGRKPIIVCHDRGFYNYLNGHLHENVQMGYTCNYSYIQADCGHSVWIENCRYDYKPRRCSKCMWEDYKREMRIENWLKQYKELRNES